MAASAVATDKKNRGKKLKSEEIRGRLVTQDELLDHFDVTVFKPNGVDLERCELKSIVDGLTRELAVVCLCGASAKLGILGTFSVSVSEEANTRLPNKEADDALLRPARLTFRSSRGIKRMLKDAAVNEKSDNTGD